MKVKKMEKNIYKDIKNDTIRTCQRIARKAIRVKLSYEYNSKIAYTKNYMEDVEQYAFLCFLEKRREKKIIMLNNRLFFIEKQEEEKKIEKKLFFYKINKYIDLLNYNINKKEESFEKMIEEKRMFELDNLVAKNYLKKNIERDKEKNNKICDQQILLQKLKKCLEGDIFNKRQIDLLKFYYLNLKDVTISMTTRNNVSRGGALSKELLEKLGASKQSISKRLSLLAKKIEKTEL